MGFHRLTVPVYAGGLRAGDDYINNATSGTPAAADNALGSGTNSGSYFFGANEQVTTAGVNRGFKALAQNCDFLDDALAAFSVKSFAAPGRAEFTGDGATTDYLISGSIYTGLAGTLSTTGINGYESFVVVTDANNNPLIGTNGQRCVVTATSGGAVGYDAFTAVGLTVTITPAPPSGAAFHVHYLKSDNFSSGQAGLFSTLMKFRKGPVKEAYRSISTGTTLTATDEFVFFTAGGFNFTLATPAAFAGRTVHLIDATGILSQSSKVTIVRAGAENINNVAASYVLDVKYGRWELYCDGTNWHVSKVHDQTLVDPTVCGFRLTGVTATPVNPSGGTYSTLYFTPYKSNQISLWDSTLGIWRLRSTAEISLALSGLTSNRNYDVFAYWDTATNTVKLELGTVWTDNTTRASVLSTQDGVPVKNGDPTRKYVGSLRSTSATTFSDGYATRHLYNWYNQEELQLAPPATLGTYTYTTATFRQAGGDVNNQVSVLIGMSTLPTKVNLEVHMMSQDGATNGGIAAGIGLDSTTVNSAQIKTFSTQSAGGVGTTLSSCYYKDTPGIGWHYYAWLEFAVNGGGDTVYNQTASGGGQSGMIGNVKM